LGLLGQGTTGYNLKELISKIRLFSPTLARVRDYLKAALDDPAFSGGSLPASLFHLPSDRVRFNLDRIDLRVLHSALALLKALIDTTAAYNWDIDLSPALGVDGRLNCQKAIQALNPTFLTEAPQLTWTAIAEIFAGVSSDVAQALDGLLFALQDASSMAKDADGTSDWSKWTSSDLALVKTVVAEIKASLTQGATRLTTFGERDKQTGQVGGLTFDLKAILDPTEPFISGKSTLEAPFACGALQHGVPGSEPIEMRDAFIAEWLGKMIKGELGDGEQIEPTLLKAGQVVEPEMPIHLPLVNALRALFTVFEGQEDNSGPPQPKH
jgi:hypothetical protein